MANPTRSILKILPTLLLLITPWAARAGSDPYAELLAKVALKDGIRWDLFGAEEKKKLEEYLALVGAPDAAAKSTLNDQLAFWINAHNACVMKLISDHMPIQDVMKIPGFRDKLNCTIAGAERTLVDIQSGVIRPLFKEPRVHFALWWGVKGGPRLLETPYTGKEIEKQLNVQTQDAFKTAQFVDWTTSAKQVTLSPLFDWFKTDFGTQNDAILEFVRRYIPKEKGHLIPKKISEARFGTFDWTLDRSSKS